MKQFFLFITLLIFTNSKSATEYFEGTIGNSKMYLSVETYENNEIGGVYFYEKSLKDIPLSGKKFKNKYVLTFGNLYDLKNFTEKFEFEKKGTDYKGFWTNNKGKNLAIVLKKLDISTYKNTYFINISNEMDLVKMAFLQFKTDSTSTFKTHEFEWLTELHGATPFLRLGKTFNSRTQNFINRKLEKKQVEMALSQLSCSDFNNYSNGNGIEYYVKISYLDTNLLGFDVSSSWYCGGAHPDFGSEGNLIDLNTGKFFELDEIIAFDSSVTTEQVGGFEAYAEYKSNYFAPKIYELINDEQHFEKPKDEDDYCDFTDLELWNFVEWSFTEKGITITPYFYRAARACQEPFLIPFEKLKPYKNSTFPYNFK